jgi:hypothetical protein
MRKKKSESEFLIPPDSPLWDGLPEDSDLRRLPDRICDILLLARAATQDLISLRDLERHLDEFEAWLEKTDI